MTKITVAEAAKILGKSERNVHTIMRKGELGECKKINGKWYYAVTKEQATAWLDKWTLSDYDLIPLRNLILKKYRTFTNFADCIGYTQEHICFVLRGKYSMTFRMIELMVQALKIPKEKIGFYFFTKKEA